MATSSVGVLLALSGDDAEILRSVNQPGSGMSVVRRCADLPELLSAGLAGLASIAILDTGFDEIDRTVLERLTRAGLSGLLLVEDGTQERWRSCGWPVESRQVEAGRVRRALQEIIRSAHRGSPASPSTGGLGGAGGPGAAGGPDAGGPGRPGDAALAGGPRDGADPGPGVDSWRDWPQAAPEAMSPAQQTAWLEDLWSRSPGDERTDWSGAGAGEPGAPTGWSTGTGPARIREPREGRAVPGRDPGAPAGAGRQAHPGRLAVVWGPHGAPGRSTVAASLAQALGRGGGSILVDADVEAPCLVQLLGLPDDSSALAGATRLATHGRLDAEAFSRFLTPVGEGVRLLGGLGRSGRWRELPPASMTEVWLQCRAAAAWTVVDVAGGPIDDGVDDFTLEPGRGAVAFDLVRHADVVVIVGAGDPVGVRRLLQLLGDLDAEAAPAGRIQVVVNRVRASAAGPSPQQAILEALGRFGGLTDVALLPEDGACADRCLLQGRSIVDGAPGSALGKALVSLAERLDPRAAAAGPRGSRRRRRAAESGRPGRSGRPGPEPSPRRGTTPARRQGWLRGGGPGRASGGEGLRRSGRERPEEHAGPPGPQDGRALPPGPHGTAPTAPAPGPLAVPHACDAASSMPVGAIPGPTLEGPAAHWPAAPAGEPGRAPSDSAGAGAARTGEGGAPGVPGADGRGDLRAWGSAAGVAVPGDAASSESAPGSVPGPGTGSVPGGGAAAPEGRSGRRPSPWLRPARGSGADAPDPGAASGASGF
ncbi:hypothetical protein [Actinomyces capricornis]|uniref:CobQ/CobB/MinD/ParA nucleotide binding domain-containing protein n=1 Tax=Actinomyces capricornis TaxID=2755559 RepID=A0ABN6K5K5_9ACTO|nr:hypothetical protein [Actinomyces capricornis]BDA63641.1 hypothetical protein MANAM107_04750 [Actinomyces capricornis]